MQGSTPQEVLWKPPLRQAALTLAVMTGDGSMRQFAYKDRKRQEKMDFKVILTMKRLFLILSVIFLAILTAFSTEQTPDKLIIGKDTIYMKSFPLENLRLKKSPFDYGRYGFPSTGCYRGYVATWQVIDENLTLKEVKKIDSIGTQLNIVEYLSDNGYNPKIKNDYVVADWYSDTLKLYDFFTENFTYKLNEYYVSKDYLKNKDTKIELIFENGKLIANNIIPIEDYKVNDTLYVNTQHYFQDWWDVWELGYNIKTQLKGVVRENNGKKVRLEIISYGTDKKRRIRKIQSKINSTNFWVNPRYCEKKE